MPRAGPKRPPTGMPPGLPANPRRPWLGPGPSVPSAETMDDPSSRPLIGVSSCLLGQRVRYDGGHKREAFVVEDLAARFELLPICPEMAIGMGVPRPPLQLILEDDGIHAR